MRCSAILCGLLISGCGDIGTEFVPSVEEYQLDAVEVAASELCEAPEPVELPQMSGGRLPDGRWVNAYSLISNEVSFVEIPINEQTVAVSGELCCYCAGSVSLEWNAINEFTTKDHSPLLGRGGVCDPEAPAVMLAAAAARGGTLTARVTVSRSLSIQRDWELQCLVGEYENVRVEIVDCDAGEQFMSFGTHDYEFKAQLPNSVCEGD